MPPSLLVGFSIEPRMMEMECLPLKLQKASQFAISWARKVVKYLQ